MQIHKLPLRVAFGIVNTPACVLVGRQLTGQVNSVSLKSYILSGLGGAVAAATLPSRVTRSLDPSQATGTAKVAWMRASMMLVDVAGAAFGVMLETSLFGRSELTYGAAVMSALVGSAFVGTYTVALVACINTFIFRPRQAIVVLERRNLNDEDRQKIEDILRFLQRQEVDESRP